MLGKFCRTCLEACSMMAGSSWGVFVVSAQDLLAQKIVSKPIQNAYKLIKTCPKRSLFFGELYTSHGQQPWSPTFVVHLMIRKGVEVLQCLYLPTPLIRPFKGILQIVEDLFDLFSKRVDYSNKRL